MLESPPLEERLMEKFRRLPAPKQQEAFRFVEFLEYSEFTLEEIVAGIRSRTAEIDMDEINTLVEEARQDYYKNHQRVV